MHIQKIEKVYIAIAIALFVMACVCFGTALTTHAEESDTTDTETETEIVIDGFTHTMQGAWQKKQSSNATYYWENETEIVSKYPIVGFSTTGDLTSVQLMLVDYDNKTSYTMTSEDGKALWYMNFGTVSAYDKPTEVLKKVNYETTGSYYEDGQQNNLLFISTGDEGFIRKFTGKIFMNEDYLNNHIQTGSMDGLLYDGDEGTDDNTDFGEDYFPDVPVPVLTKLSHNGFTVTNSASDLELDIVVKSWFYGMKHDKNSDTMFSVDTSKVVAYHHYENIIDSEIGFTGSVVDFSNTSYFHCKNRLDLFNDGLEYYNNYPTHNKLPDYEALKHMSSDYALYWTKFASAYDVGQDYATALATTGQACTKYYVRFRQLQPLSTGDYGYKNGQWYCYTYGPSKKASVSPVEGDNDGNPIETDPTDGEEDEDGNIDYDDGIEVPDINIDNPLQMIKSFFDMIAGLPDMIGGISFLLQDLFCFIPDFFWTAILYGVYVSCVLLIFRLIK